MLKSIRDAAGVSRLESMIESMRRLPGDPQRELNKLLASTRENVAFRDEALLQLSGAVVPGRIAFLDQMEKERERYRQWFTLASSSHAQSVREIQRLRIDIEGQLDLVSTRLNVYGVQDQIHRIQELAQGVMEPSSSAAIATAFSGWKAAFGRQHPDGQISALTAAFANPLNETARALRESAEILARTDNPAIRVAVEQAIIFADVELNLSRESAQDFGGSDLIATASPPRRLLSPSLQRQDFRRLSPFPSAEDAINVFSSTPTGQLVSLALTALQLVVAINEDRRLANLPVVFKPTTRLLRVFAELPLAVAVDASSFADFVDDLYWLLYEGAGSDSLRFLKNNAGELADSECAVIFAIKRFRNFYRHDFEHGNERDIEKKLASLTGDLALCGIDCLPRKRAEYRNLQRAILQQTVVFLERLSAMTRMRETVPQGVDQSDA